MWVVRTATKDFVPAEKIFTSGSTNFHSCHLVLPFCLSNFTACLKSLRSIPGVAETKTKQAWLGKNDYVKDFRDRGPGKPPIQPPIDNICEGGRR